VAESLLASLFTILACLAAGGFLLRRLRADVLPYEFAFLSLISGALIVSMAVYLLALVGWIGRIPFALLGVICIGLGAPAWRGWRPPRSRTPLWLLAASPFAVLYLVNALAPEVSPDGTSYHLAFVARYAAAGRFLHFQDSLFAALTQGFEMLFLFAFVFGRDTTQHSAAACVHCWFLLLSPLGFLAVGERKNQMAAATAAAMLFFMTPIVGKAGVSAYVDVAVAMTMLGLYVAVQCRLWGLAGALAGFAFDIKITAGLAGLYGFLLARGARLRFASMAALVAAPWLIRNALVFGNPLAPFGNELFPNPYFSADKMAGLAEALRQHNGVTWAEVPRELLVDGFRLGGLFGPVFALAPIASFCRDWRLLLFAAIALAPYPMNLSARFLMPAAPALLLGLTAVLSRFPFLLVLVVAAHGVLSIPSVVAEYASPHAWRIYEYPWKAAWRRDVREEFLRVRMSDYDAGRMLDANVPKGETVLVIPGLQRAYHRTNMLVGYESARATRAEDTLLADLQPTWRHEFPLPGVVASEVSIVQTNTQTAKDSWTISEVDGAGFTATASHAPEVAGLALDGLAATRWASGVPFRPEMRFTLRWSTPQRLESLVAWLTPDQGQLALAAEYVDSQGVRKRVPAVVSNAPKRTDMPRESVKALRALGVSWVLIRDDDTDRSAWPMSVAAKQGPYTLYRLATSF
jgi:hypothetical protein